MAFPVPLLEILTLEVSYDHSLNLSHNIVSDTPSLTNLTAIYTSPTTVSLTWTFTIITLHNSFEYIVYYKLGETSQNVSFNGNRDVKTM